MIKYAIFGKDQLEEFNRGKNKNKNVQLIFKNVMNNLYFNLIRFSVHLFRPYILYIEMNEFLFPLCYFRFSVQHHTPHARQ